MALSLLVLYSIFQICQAGLVNPILSFRIPLTIRTVFFQCNAISSVGATYTLQHRSAINGLLPLKKRFENIFNHFPNFGILDLVGDALLNFCSQIHSFNRLEKSSHVGGYMVKKMIEQQEKQMAGK